MKTLSMGFLVVTIVTSFGAYADQMNLDQINAKTFKAINEKVSAGAYPQTCIINYALDSSHESHSAQFKPPTPAEVDKMLAGVKTPEDLKRLTDQIKTAHPDVTVDRLTATLTYKIGGVLKVEKIIDIQGTSADSPQTAIKNIATVVEHFADRYCPQTHSKIEPKDEYRSTDDKAKFVGTNTGTT